MLKPRKRLSKKKLKEDKLVTFYYKASAWAEDNLKYVVGAIAAIVIIFVAVYFYANSQKGAEQKASVELAKATRTFENGDYQNALPLLTNLVEKYGSTKSGKMGFLYLADSFFETNDYENAKINYKKFASSFKGDEHILSAAYAGVAASDEQLKNYQEAAQGYEKTVKKFPDSIFSPNCLLRAARCYTLAKMPDEAKNVYDKLLKDYPDAQEKDEALMLKAML